MSTTPPTARTGCLPAMEPWWEVVLPKGGSARGSGSVDALKSAARCWKLISSSAKSSSVPTIAQSTGKGRDESRLRRCVLRDHCALLVNGCRCRLDSLAREIRAEKVCEVRATQRPPRQKPRRRRDCRKLISPHLLGAGSRNNLAAKKDLAHSALSTLNPHP